MDRRRVGLLTLAHLLTDLNQGALPALLPLLIVRHDLTYAAAAAVVFSSNVASTIIQPVFGYLTDRRPRPWLLPLALVLACTGVAASGLVPAYALLVLAAVVSGTGVAAFHPVAARLVNLYSGDRKGGAMSFFGVGGTMGFTFGPILAAAATGWWGLSGTAALAVPGCLLAVVGFPALAREPGEAGPRAARSAKAAGRAAWGPFLRLSGAIVGRSMLFFGFNTFIPLYWIHVLGRSEQAGAMALACFAGATVVGSLAGGWLADRFSQPRIILASFVAIIPLVPLFLLASSPLVAAGVLVLLGLGISLPYSAMIVLGQDYLPGQLGLSSGVTLGLAISIGGVTAPLLGLVADAHGLAAALGVAAVFPVLSAASAFRLPKAAEATAVRAG